MPRHTPSERALMLVTDPVADVATVVAQVKAAVRGGVSHVLMRRPGPDEEYASLASRLVPVVAEGGATLLVHGRPEVATRIDGCGLHIPGRSLAEAPQSPARPFGVSVHSTGEANAAVAAGADYVLFGHIYETESHPGQEGRGLDALREVCAAVGVPVLAIGGIKADRVAGVMAAGASGVAVQRSITDASNPEDAARGLREALDDTKGHSPMQVTVNNERIDVDGARTLASFLAEREIPAASIVIAVNDDIIPRSSWETYELKENDVVDIVYAVSGGDHDLLEIAGQTFLSRLFLGTGKYADNNTMVRALEASGTEMVTVAIRHMNLNLSGEGQGQEPILDRIDRQRYRLLPNTAGAYTVKDAVKMARLARAATGTAWIKLEVIGDQRTLWPDVAGTIEATRILVEDGFVVLPYTSPDLVAALRLEEAGAATVMPLASPIGSGAGMQDWKSIERIVQAVSVPVVVDAGIGVPSDAALAMELGADAVLVNTAVAKATDPADMAQAMRLGVEAGRIARRAGRMPVSEAANPSSPVTGVPVAIE